MSYQVIARRWRPQSFNEIVYQDHVSKTIANSIKNDRISHSYIFTGPRGVGKTTTARILAKSLNCVEGPTSEPCGVCENCLEIKDGTSFDVIEIDGASNNSVDNIRDLREKVNFAPVKGRYKVYIIDEVHMLSRGAFNALLKTLEEPPPHVIFIFATTEIHKVPDTILSRCQKFYFKKITPDVIVEHLTKIVTSEGMAVEESALYAIARAAGGSMRDAQSLLEQIISFSDGNIKLDDTLSILGIVPISSYFSIFNNIIEQNGQGLFQEVEKLISSGVDIKRYTDGMVEFLRAIRLVKNSIPIENIIGYSSKEIDRMKELVKSIFDEELSGFYRILLSLQRDLKLSSNERINLEMAVLDMMALKGKPTIASIMDKLSDLKESPAGASGNPQQNMVKKKSLTEEPPTTGRPSYESFNPSNQSNQANQNKVDRNITREEAIPVNSREGQADDPSNGDNGIKETWNKFLSKLKIVKQYIYMKLIKASIEFGDNEILVKYNSHGGDGRHNSLLDSKDISFINEEISKMAGYRITLKIKNKQETIPEDKLPEHLPEAQMMKTDDYSKIEQDHPVVKKVMEMFYGEIVEKGDR